MTTVRPEPTEGVAIFPDDDNKGDSGKETTVTADFRDLPVIDLLSENSPLTTKLCLMLNRRNNRVIRNWKNLAYEIGIPRDVSLSFDCDSEHSPTEDLFEYLISWDPDMNFSKLKEKLKAAGRNDLILILKKGGYEDEWKIADNMDFVDQFKDKLDVPKRHMDWKALASKLKIPRKEMEKFGKPKLGPTEHLFIHTRITSAFESLTVGNVKKHLENMKRFDVIKIFENHKLEDNAYTKEVLKSQSAIMDEVSKLLDKDGPMKNWKNLAYMLNIPEETYQGFDDTRGNNNNPTNMMFEWIYANKPDFTVGALLKCLRNIDRNDVALELCNGVDKCFKEQKLITQKQGEVFIAVKSGPPSSISSNQENNHLPLQNTEHLSSVEKEDLFATNLPNSLYQRICNMLDTEESFYRDYRMLGEELGVDKVNIELLKQKWSSPTHKLLLDYKIKVKELEDILKKIDREDIAFEIQSWLVPSPSQ